MKSDTKKHVGGIRKDAEGHQACWEKVSLELHLDKTN
jgi:hypothetical protein